MKSIILIAIISFGMASCTTKATPEIQPKVEISAPPQKELTPEETLAISKVWWNDFIQDFHAEKLALVSFKYNINPDTLQTCLIDYLSIAEAAQNDSTYITYQNIITDISKSHKINPQTLSSAIYDFKYEYDNKKGVNE